MERPRIGLPTYSRAEDEKGRFTLYAQYVDGVRRAGGLPLLLPPAAEMADELSQLLDLCDGWVLTGGGDVDPTLYGGRSHETIYNVDPERDACELDLIRAILEHKQPALCICRGMQLLNVALGGTLIEHLPEDDLAHRAPPRVPVRHPIEVAPDSRLAQVLGETRMEPFSWHHQAVRDLAGGLRVVARAPDGVIEAVEDDERPELLCVQWHPELSAHEEQTQQRLFDGLVELARGGGGTEPGTNPPPAR